MDVGLGMWGILGPEILSQVTCADKMWQWLVGQETGQLKMKAVARASEIGYFGWHCVAQSLSLPPPWAYQWLSSSPASWAWPVPGQRALLAPAPMPLLLASRLTLRAGTDVSSLGLCWLRSHAPLFSGPFVSAAATATPPFFCVYLKSDGH